MASRAVVIGPAGYAKDSGIAGYAEIGASARKYGEVLASDEMWGPNSCRVLGQDEVHTADGVMQALQEEAGKTGPDDIFLVVYVGHGAHWTDLPGHQVHFSVGSSRDGEPWTWLSSWYVYRTMRNCKAKLKLLIVDCCFSNLLPQLGAESALPGVMGATDEGTCVFTALKKSNYWVDAKGCDALPGDLPTCTPFSGHLLNILSQGTKDYHPQLTIGLLREAVKEEMQQCRSQHDEPRMLLNDAREGIPLFTNRKDPASRNPRPRVPVEPEQWVSTLVRDSESDLEELLADPRKTGDVVALLLRALDERSRHIAQRINARANEKFLPHAFARYWNRVEPVLRG